MQKMLDIGCGERRDEGYLTADISGKPDVICDARYLPFRARVFSKVRMLHVLEHIPREHLVKTINECHRVVETGAELEIEVPIFPSDDAMADPTHVSFFVPRTFDYFVDGAGHDEHRRLYGIKKWEYIDRERLGYNSIVNVRLTKCE